MLIKLQPLIKVEEYINNVTFFARNFMLYFQASSPLVLMLLLLDSKALPFTSFFPLLINL